MPVKLILRESVDHLGSPGEIVSVAPGYARNYLLPKGLAFEATPGNLKMLERKRKVWEARSMQEVEQVRQLAARLSALDLTIEKKAGGSRTLFGSVTNVEIAALLAKQGFELDRRQIVLKAPIKSLGNFEISIKLHPKVTGQIQLQVLPEGGRLEDESASGGTADSGKETTEGNDAEGPAAPAARVDDEVEASERSADAPASE